MEDINLIDLIKEQNQTLLKRIWLFKKEGNDWKKFNQENNDLKELKIHKILYFQFGYFFKKFNKPLFDANFEAWRYGPVEKDYRNKELKKFNIQPTSEEKKYLEDITSNLLKYSTYTLVEQSHLTDPWKNNHKGDKEKWKEIPIKEIEKYFSKNQDD